VCSYRLVFPSPVVRVFRLCFLSLPCLVTLVCCRSLGAATVLIKSSNEIALSQNYSNPKVVVIVVVVCLTVVYTVPTLFCVAMIVEWECCVIRVWCVCLCLCLCLCVCERETYPRKHTHTHTWSCHASQIVFYSILFNSIMIRILFLLYSNRWVYCVHSCVRFSRTHISATVGTTCCEVCVAVTLSRYIFSTSAFRTDTVYTNCALHYYSIVRTHTLNQ